MELTLAKSTMAPDPLDAIDPPKARWEAFKRQLAQAQVLQWLLSELSELAPDYAGELSRRLETAFLDYPDIFRLDGNYDGWVPVLGPGESAHTTVWMREEDAAALHQSLFPHGHRETRLPETGRALAVVALHGAVELYALSIGVQGKKGLPRAVRDLLASRGLANHLDSDTFETFTELDAVRHIVVHRDGIVDDRYVRSTASSALLIGERRTVTPDDLHRFGAAVRNIGELLLAADASAS